MTHCIYDLEIIKAIPTNEPKVSGIAYCDGWTDYVGMGISVGAVCWLDDDGKISESIPLRTPEQIKAMLTNQSAPYGGFNTLRFDDNLLKAHGVEAQSSFDILNMVIAAAGETSGSYRKKGHKYNLAFIGEANGFGKMFPGALAPIHWQQGRHQEVVDYCCHDVQIEALCLSLLLNGDLIDPNTGQKLRAV